MTRRVLVYLAVMTGIALISSLLILAFGNSIQISCERSVDKNPTCRITTILLGKWLTSSHTVAGVTGVQMEEDCDDDGCSYRALLETSSGTSVPVNEVYTDEAVAQRQIEALQGFLGSTQSTFEYTEPVQWWAVVLLIGMDLVGAAIVVGNFLREAMRG
jgi:hypothetical protein